MSYKNIEMLNASANKHLSASKEETMIASFEAKQRALARVGRGKFLPLPLARRKYGTISQVMLDKKKYVSVKEGDDTYQGMYLVRDNLTHEPRAYNELLGYDKLTKTNKPKQRELGSINLKQLPFFSNIQSMFSDIKEIGREESLVAFKTDGSKVPEDIEEYQFNDGFLVYEPVEYITYRASFGDRSIVYTSNDKTHRIFNVMSYNSYELNYKARNKWLAELNSIVAINDRYEQSAISKADRELCISQGVYGEQSLYMY